MEENIMVNATLIGKPFNYEILNKIITFTADSVELVGPSNHEHDHSFLYTDFKNRPLKNSIANPQSVRIEFANLKTASSIELKVINNSHVQTVLDKFNEAFLKKISNVTVTPKSEIKSAVNISSPTSFSKCSTKDSRVTSPTVKPLPTVATPVRNQHDLKRQSITSTTAHHRLSMYSPIEKNSNISTVPPNLCQVRTPKTGSSVVSSSPGYEKLRSRLSNTPSIKERNCPRLLRSPIAESSSPSYGPQLPSFGRELPKQQSSSVFSGKFYEALTSPQPSRVAELQNSANIETRCSSPKQKFYDSDYGQSTSTSRPEHHATKEKNTIVSYLKIDKYLNRRLANTGNSCYLNSGLQALAACYSFVSRCNQLNRLMLSDKKYYISLETMPKDIEKNKMKVRIFEFFVDIIGNLSNRSEKPRKSSLYRTTYNELAGFLLYIGAIDREFQDGDQKDAHEFLTVVLGIVDDVVKFHLKPKFSNPIIQRNLAQLNPLNALSYKIENSLVCQHCGYEKEPTHSRDDWSFPLPMCSKEESIIDLLEESFSVTLVQRGLCRNCRCAKSYSRERFSKFPSCLVLNLMRYHQEPGQELGKNNRFIEIPPTMNLSKFGMFHPVEQDQDENLNYDAFSFESFNAYKGPTFNSTSAPILMSLNGGAMEEERELSMNSDDCKISEEIVKNPMIFKWISEKKEIERMLLLLNIVDLNYEYFKKHIEKLSVEKPTAMSKFDSPGKQKSIHADGNCFFRSISWCLTGSESHHTTVRQAIANYLKNNEQMVKKYCEEEDPKEYVEKMGQDGTWATNTEITALANLLDVNIYTYLTNGWICTTPIAGPSNNGAFYLTNEACHYEPVLSLEAEFGSRRRLKRKASDKDYEDGSGDWKRDTPMKKTNSPFDTPQPKKQPRRNGNGVAGTYRSMNSSPVEPVNYRLIAAICHEGGLAHKGHYIAFTRDLYNDDEWLCCSDQEITEVSEEYVLFRASTEGYLLFYDRQDL